ncbi:hypothetical protein CSC81_18280, partial [Tenacibaculum discolor]
MGAERPVSARLVGAYARPDKIGLAAAAARAWTWPVVNHKEKAMSLSVPKIAPAAVILIGALGLGGCATKTF